MFHIVFYMRKKGLFISKIGFLSRLSCWWKPVDGFRMVNRSCGRFASKESVVFSLLGSMVEFAMLARKSWLTRELCDVPLSLDTLELS